MVLTCAFGRFWREQLTAGLGFTSGYSSRMRGRTEVIGGCCQRAKHTTREERPMTSSNPSAKGSHFWTDRRHFMKAAGIAGAVGALGDLTRGEFTPITPAQAQPAKPIDHKIFELKSAPLQSGIDFRGVKVSYKTYGQLAPDKSNVIVVPSYYSETHHEGADWLTFGGQDSRSEPLLHHLDKHAGGRLVLFAEQRCPAVRRQAVPEGDGYRQRAHATAPGEGGVRHREGRARLWLVDGRTAGLSLGRAVPRYGRANSALFAAQPAPP